MTAEEALAVRPGQVVAIAQLPPDAWNPSKLKDGDEFAVADPPRDEGCSAPHLIVLDGRGGLMAIGAEVLRLAGRGEPTPAPCTCPIPALMASGCRCGAIAREREAVAG